jgi:hypothetical protein
LPVIKVEDADLSSLGEIDDEELMADGKQQHTEAAEEERESGLDFIRPII